MIEIALDREGGLPLSKQIADALRAAILRGEIAAGARLPAERALGRRLGVDRMTVSRAYADLDASRLVSRQVGRGSFVLAAPAPAAASRRSDEPAPRGILWSSAFAGRTARLTPVGAGAAPAEGAISFSSLFPDPSLFPVDAFRRAIEAAIRREGSRLFGYGAAGGYPPLRRYIAASQRERGVAVDEDEIVITNGSQQGIDLVARALLDPGDRVAVENPTYTGAVQVFQSHGARVVGVPVDEEGMIPDRLEEAVSRSGVKLLYLIPNFQNPTSGTMSVSRRRALLDIAARHGVPILEDDFGGALRYEGEEVPCLKTLDHGGRVIYMSTFAKKLLPGIRIGWLAAAREVAEKLGFLKQIADWNTSLLLQGALYEFCRRGDLDRHLRRVLAAYRERRDTMIEAMRRHFPREARFARPEGGLVVWVTLPPGLDSDEVAMEAQGKGVLVGRGDTFYVDGGTHNNLRLVFAQAGPADIRRGIRILGSILRRRLRERRAAVAPGLPEPLSII